MRFSDFLSIARNLLSRGRRRQHRSLAFEEPRRTGSGRRKRDLDDGGVPAEPNNPRNLSGGAAAALEFDN